MTPERWQRAKAIIAAAAELEGAARTDYVARECSGDTDLREEVESVLRHAGDDVEGAAEALNSLRVSDAADGLAGSRLGAYEIVREVGRGGMGAVYLARRADAQFEKQVAIKILKRGTDTDEVLRRFGAERQILARLEHPNIARLIDAGTTGDGLPYFVMEYVEGSRITDYCSANGLSIPDRLALFLKVCAAVQVAHQNLIVHRDIKPGNIFVTPEGEPKLLDFGIAKLLAPDSDFSDPTLTLPDQQRLTPGYASPEQVRGAPITTVSDVYSLGALLYELVTGAPPHRFATPHPSPSELLRVIAEEEPAAPSTATSDAAVRNRLRGDIDNILLQALRKEPARRYPGVTALAEDIRRHLNKFPVRARRDTVGYRTRRFVQRHRLGVAAAAIVVLALLAGITVAAWQARVAAEQAAVARAERAKAEQRFNQVRELARSVMFDYHDQIAALPGSTAVRQTLVRDALKYLDNLAREAGDDRALLRELADAYSRVAAVQGGKMVSQGGSLLTEANLRDTAGARASQTKALSIYEQLAKGSGNDPADLKALAAGHERLAAMYLSTGPPETSVEHSRKAQAILEPLLATAPKSEELRTLTADVYVTMGTALGATSGPNVGDAKGALEYLGKALALREQLTSEYPANQSYQERLGNTHNLFGIVYGGMAETDKQFEHSQKSLAIFRALSEAEPANATYKRFVAIESGNIGTILRGRKDVPQALVHFREALALYESLVAADPNDVMIRRQWAVAVRNVAVTVGVTNRDEALQHYDKAVGILRDISSKDPQNTDFRRQWAFTTMTRARFLWEANDPAGSAQGARDGIRIAEEVIAASPGDASAHSTLALLYMTLGGAHQQWTEKPDIAPHVRREHWQAAKDAYAKCLGIYDAMKTKGVLGGADAKRIDGIAGDLAKCEAALSSGDPATATAARN